MPPVTPHQLQRTIEGSGRTTLLDHQHGEARPQCDAEIHPRDQQQQGTDRHRQQREQDDRDRTRRAAQRIEGAAEETRMLTTGDPVLAQQQEHPHPETGHRRASHQAPPDHVLALEQGQRLAGRQQIDGGQIAEQHREQRPRQAPKQGTPEQQEGRIQHFTRARGAVVREKFHGIEGIKPCVMTDLSHAGTAPTW